MNIIICRTEPKHAQGLQQLYANPSVYTQTIHLPSQSVDTWQKRLSNIPTQVYSFVAITHDDTQKIVGNIALTVETAERRRHIGSFVIAVSDDYQGLGIGKQLLHTMIDLADNWLNLNRIELTVFTDNDKAIGLYKKFGFVIEGEHTNFAFRNGSFVNAYTMARIKA